MKINADKLKQVLEILNKGTGGYCASSSVFIGEINGAPIQLTVMTTNEAQNEHDYAGTLADYLVIEEQE